MPFAAPTPPGASPTPPVTLALSTSAPPERPPYGPQSRQHSRSSSQVATMAGLALSPASPRMGGMRPLAQLAGGDQQQPPPPWRSASSSPAKTAGSYSPRGAGARSRRASAEARAGSAAEEEAESSGSSAAAEDEAVEGDERHRGRTASGSTEPTSSSSGASNAVPTSSRKERRRTLPAHLDSTSSPLSTSPPSTSTSSPVLPPTDPSTPAQSSFPSTSTSLAQFIQHKRRQASAPYFASARSQSLFSPGAGFSLGPSASEATGGGRAEYAGSWGSGAGGAGSSPSSVAAGGLTAPGDDELPPPPSRNRSRASSRRATATGLALQTQGLLVPPALDPDAGLVVTPTTEEWRVLGSELSDLKQEREREDAVGAEGGGERNGEEGARDKDDARDKAPSPRKPRWKRWPSLQDEDSSDEDDEDDDANRFALSLSLSNLGRFQHHLPHTPPPIANDGEEQLAPPPARPSQYKSSFSYTSTGAGVTGGFTSHSNTNSISSLSAGVSPSGAPGSSSSGARSPSSVGMSPSVSLPGSDGPATDALFKPTHRAGQKSEPSLAVSHLQVQAPRPALSRGSLSAATGGLSSPPIGSPASGSEGAQTARGEADDDGPDAQTPTAGDDDAAARQKERAEQEAHAAATANKAGLPQIPLPPSVFRSLEEGARSGDASPRSGANGFSLTAASGGRPDTPASYAATPYDGDPFASSAPGDVSVPPTPMLVPPGAGAVQGGGSTPAAGDESPSFSLQSGTGQAGAPSFAVDLDWSKPLGPVDPRTYSAVTGLRDINAFVCADEEAGKGAYGSVRRARQKGPDGKAVGPELIIKYVIKQRILADCWKKHKILGPIPIEVHVLDHLRRVPYEPRPRLNYLSRRQGGVGSRPSKGLPVRRDSAPRLDLWKGGADGGIVQTGHPSICPLLDFWEDAHHYHLVMPAATASPIAESDGSIRHGQDLFDFVDAHPDGLPPSPIQRILSQIADAVYFLHGHSIVHRDIKDENCVLDPDGNVRLIDFGSAAYVKEGRKFDTFSGTLDFAAPEVLKGARYSGKEQDIWALGVLGYVLICGECPFWSPDEAMRGIQPDTRAYSALQAKIASSTTSTPSLPPAPSDDSDVPPPTMADAVDLVMRCLEIDPQNRPTADMICDHAFLAGAQDGWRGLRGWEKADVPSEPED
ncbi:hypothetical protein Rhopal_004930-T1 [Rhodotorula paludigena]|uniref:Protein kinase domain-containing protein n=1 Tax=Rhodotorula paludigena TaxID=86838 RepID=A0AAV5GQX0_9BASI|nr:hypothetical protein Rhopal_004930-T1 [Rhodotorula paludigena]